MGGRPGGFRIESATADTEDEAARVLAAAFADDPTVAFLVPPDTPERSHRLRRMFRAEIHTCGFDHVDVALDDATDAVVGAGVWAPPYANLDGVTAIRWSLVAAGALRAHGLRAGARYDRAVRRHRPGEPHWHLLDLGTSPDARGLGVGTALLRHRLTVVDLEGRRAFLEATTAATRRLYERFDFEVVGRLPRVTGGAYAMVRPATGQ